MLRESMTASTPEEGEAAFERHEAFESAPEGYRLTTTAFEALATAGPAEAEWALTYTVMVRVPSLGAAAEETVGPAVIEGWLDTLERRLADAPKAIRASVDLDTFAVETDDETVVITYAFTFGDPDRAVGIVKTFVEYVEGTYVEGIVPGYDYGPPVEGLLDAAESGGAQSERGGTPL